jgi:hypothetical protein
MDIGQKFLQQQTFSGKPYSVCGDVWLLFFLIDGAWPHPSPNCDSMERGGAVQW